MSFAELQRLLPIGKSFRQLKCWVMNYVAEEFFWDMQLVLKAAEVPADFVRPGRLVRLDELVEEHTFYT